VSADDDKDDDVSFSADPRWLRFLAALSDKGYFKVRLCP